jgi:hypothetical protein
MIYSKFQKLNDEKVNDVERFIPAEIYKETIRRWIPFQ